MFAVIKTGGKQYRVAPNDVLAVGKIAGEPGSLARLSDVLMVGGETPVIGNPVVAGASVMLEVVEHKRGPKVIAFKKRRRKNSRRKRGYRDEFTVVRVAEILTDGKEPTVTAAPKPVKAKPEAGAAEAPAEKNKAAKPAAKKAAAKPAAKSAAKAPAKAATKSAAKKPAAKTKK
jgi:large subunit ribosomal protein L21